HPPISTACRTCPRSARPPLLNLPHPPRTRAFFFQPPRHPRAPHSFPTRRSSDLKYLDERGIDQDLAKRFGLGAAPDAWDRLLDLDRKSTRLNSSHVAISYAVFCLKKKRGRVRLRRDGYSEGGERPGVGAGRVVPV